MNEQFLEILLNYVDLNKLTDSQIKDLHTELGAYFEQQLKGE